MSHQKNIDTLFLYASEGIIVVDNHGAIKRINPSGEKLFGYNKDELIGKKIEVLIPKRFSEDHKIHREHYNHVPRKMGGTMELFALKYDGTEFPVEISLSPYPTEEGKYTIAFIMDITQRKLFQEELKSYSTDLEKQVRNRTLILEEAVQALENTKKELHQALQKEMELNELKSRFVSMASHEFRTPLTTMLSSLSLIAKYGELNDQSNQLKHINKIKVSIGNLTEILNDFLSVSRLEEGRIENNPADFNVKAFILDIISEMQSLAPAGQKLTGEHLGDEIVHLDMKLLKNILFNLISNAIKFSPNDGIIEVKSIVSGMSVKITVKDNGIGIPAEDQKHLFERFFRGHNASHIQGTGLGLNIVTKYAELMNGYLDFSSKENEGSLFIIIFPR